VFALAKQKQPLPDLPGQGLFLSAAGVTPEALPSGKPSQVRIRIE